MPTPVSAGMFWRESDLPAKTSTGFHLIREIRVIRGLILLLFEPRITRMSRMDLTGARRSLGAEATFSMGLSTNRVASRFTP